jgi:glutamate/tyrosine decarboxylase-like PLP-dependent enzyme
MPHACGTPRAALALHGAARTDVERELAAMSEADRRSLNGVKFGRRFFGGEGPFEVASSAYGLFAQSNRSSLYPGQPGISSIGRMHQDLVDHALDLLNAPPGGAGVVTSGGTESVILALKAAVTRAKSRGLAVHEMQVVAAQSAHPCIDKAAELLNVCLKRVPTGRNLTADVAAMAAELSPATVLIYASFPSYPYGLVDDISALGALADSRGVWLHVDACMSGLLAPFARLNGEAIPDFDFSVPGVASVSADLHKHGYSAKGASLVLFRSAELARLASFSYANHPLPPMNTPTLAGTAPGAPIASAWAVMKYLGVAGYRDLAARLFASRKAIVAAIESVPGFAVIGQPLFSVVVVTSELHDLEKVRAELSRRRWFTLPVLQPSGIHLNVGPFDQPLALELAQDLRAAVETLRE